jgi:septum formation topological specificity factor MinE
MRVSHECTAHVTPESAAERLQAFIAGRRSSKKPCGDMECFERELHEYVAAVEREVLAEELARLEVDLPAVTIEGEVYRQVVRCEES